MQVELQDDIETVVFEVKDEYAAGFLKSRLDAGKSFDIFFPEYEVNAE